jgi:hypothetical protein
MTAAGTKATAIVTGNDTAGTVTVTVGQPAQAATKTTPAITAPTAGDLVELVFTKAFGNAPHILITPDDGTSVPMEVYPDQRSTTGFDISVAGTPQPNATYTFDYLVVQ